MSKPTVSNRNERALSIFKVAGIYLLTLLFLVFIFLANRSVMAKDPQNLLDQHDQMKEELQQLHAIFQQLDTLASLSGQLVNLDKKLVKEEDPLATGPIVMQIQEAEVLKKKFSGQMFNLQPVSGNETELNVAKKIYSLFESTRSQILELRKQKKEELITLSADCETQCEEAIESLEQKIEKLEEKVESEKSKIDNQKDEIARLKSQQPGSDPCDKVQRRLDDCEEKFQSNEALLSALQVDVAKLYGKAEEALRERNRSILRQQVDIIHTELGLINNSIESRKH